MYNPSALVFFSIFGWHLDGDQLLFLFSLQLNYVMAIKPLADLGVAFRIRYYMHLVSYLGPQIGSSNSPFVSVTNIEN